MSLWIMVMIKTQEPGATAADGGGDLDVVTGGIGVS